MEYSEIEKAKLSLERIALGHRSPKLNRDVDYLRKFIEEVFDMHSEISDLNEQVYELNS